MPNMKLVTENFADESKSKPKMRRLYELYKTLKKELGRRPTYLELYLWVGSLSRVYRVEFGSYPGFLCWAGELSDEERQAFERAEQWLREIECTRMTKSYKMVLLLIMLERGPKCWRNPITAREAAPGFHQYIAAEAYRSNRDFADRKTQSLAKFYDEGKVTRLIAENPMKYLGESSNGVMTHHSQTQTLFVNQEVVVDSKRVYEWTKEICLYRLHVYFQRSQ